MEYTYWELEYRHTVHGWVGTGQTYRNRKAAERRAAASERYRVSEPKTASTSDVPGFRVAF